MKVAVIGAGNVGSTLAMRIVESNIADVVLLDIVEGLAKGKALDISDASAIVKHEKNIIGTSNYNDMNGSDVVVIAAGFPRKPGMSREDLISKNAAIIKEASRHIYKICPHSIVIVVTNPLDIMCYYLFKLGSFPKSKIMGMAGTLDSARFKHLIAEELKVPHKEIETLVLGSHGDTMVPIISRTFVNKRPLSSVMKTEKIKELVNKTKDRGAEIVSCLKTGSAYYSPSAGVLEILKAIRNDSGDILSVSAYLEGEYGVKDCFIGVPAKIGKRGIEEIVELDLSKEEHEAFKASVEKIRQSIAKLPITKIQAPNKFQ